MTALREVKLLRELKDPNIVQLLDAFVHKDNLALVVLLTFFALGFIAESCIPALLLTVQMSVFTI